MPRRKAAFIELSPKQEKILMEFKSGTHSMLHLKKRAEIILLAASGEHNTSIHNTMGLERNAIMLWRNRYAAANMELCIITPWHDGSHSLPECCHWRSGGAYNQENANRRRFCRA